MDLKILFYALEIIHNKNSNFILRAVHFIIDDIKDIEKNDSTLNIKYINYLGQQKNVIFMIFLYNADLMCESLVLRC